jgi:hypothetical protein
LAEATQTPTDERKSNRVPAGGAVAPQLFEMFVNPYRVGSWSALDKVPNISVRAVQRAAHAFELPRADHPRAIWEEPDGLANLLLHEERDQLWRGALRSMGGSVD